MTAPTQKQPTIVRIWRGRTPRDRADEYEAYNYEVGIRPLLSKALGVQTFRADCENETEFMTISYWGSVEAMSKFTGGDPKQIHHLERDAEFLIELPKECRSSAFLPAMRLLGPRRNAQTHVARSTGPADTVLLLGECQ